MSPRDTRTGAVLEAMVLPALERGGYTCQKQAKVGPKLGGGTHQVDVVARTVNGKKFLISLKWQQGSGTAEQKVPFEVMRLVYTMQNSGNEYSHAYVVLGGEGWSLRQFYTSGGLDEYMKHTSLVTIITLEAFVARANKGQL